jgi:hypothetical protein
LLMPPPALALPKNATVLTATPSNAVVILPLLLMPPKKLDRMWIRRKYDRCW